MSPPRLTLLPLLILLAFATPALAQDDPRSREIAGLLSNGLDQVVYKGLVGNALDAIPMDPSDRLRLQRTNAVVSNTMLGRSLATLVGLSNPFLLVGGFLWGMWAASNIKPADAGTTLAANADPGRAGGAGMAAARADMVPEPIVVSSISTAGSDFRASSRPQVVKVWLPQRSPMPLQ